MIRAIWEYIRERKWRYVKIAMVLILYDYTLLIPTQVIQRLVDHLSQRTLTQSNFVWDMVLLVGSAILNYLTAFIGSCDSFSRQSISRRPSRVKHFVS